MRKFKAGDRVKRIGEHSYNGMHPGDTDKVINPWTSDHGGPPGVRLLIHGYGHAEDSLELIEEGKMEDQEIVDKINEGFKLMCEHKDRIEWFTMHGEWKPVTTKWDYKVRLKKKEFTPFQVQGWTVSVKGDKVKIGCQEFDLAELKTYFKLTKQAGYLNSALGFVINRHGLWHNNTNNQLTWESVDKILAALEAYNE